MWWKKYIGNPHGVGELKRSQLEDLLIASCEQYEKMQKQQHALESEIKDLSVESIRKAKVESSARILQNMKGSEICPSNYAASHHRASQLEAQLFQLKNDLAMLNDTISYDDEVLRQMVTAYQVEQPVPKQSLKIGPFNNSDLRKIMSFLTDLQNRTDDPEDLDEITLCINLLNGDSRSIGKFMSNIRENFENTREHFENEIDSITTQCQTYIKKTAKLRESMEALSKLSEQIMPQMPSVRRDLIARVESLGDTHTPYLEAEKNVKQLREKKESLKDECTEYASGMILQPLENGDQRKMLDESVQIKEDMLYKEMQINEQRQRTQMLESLVASAQEALKQSNNDIEDIKEQCRKVVLATDEKKGRIQELDNLSMKLRDVEIIQTLATKTTVDQISDYLKEMREKVDETKKRKTAVKMRVTTMKDQSKRFSKQIREMKDLLQVSQC